MKIDQIKVYVLEFILLAILSFALFVSNIFDRVTVSILLTFCAIVACFILKKRKGESIHAKKVTILLIIFAIIYLVAFYAMGLYFGYYKATFTLSLKTILNYILPMALIIISSEILRNIFLAQNIKGSKVLTFIIMVLSDIIIYYNIYDMTSYDKMLEIVGFTLFASIACNLLYNYVSDRYGIIGNIFYRLITIVYIYIIPYIPNVFLFFRSILRMVYPYIIYQVLEYTFAKNNMTVAMEDKRKNIIGKVVLGIITVSLAMLISCQFKYGILVIGSGSMTGAINKGDAIFFEQYDKKDKLETGQVIIFEKDNLQVVHRVVDIKKVNGETRYTTKGDANQKNDDGYITNENIIGVCKFRIAYIGYPSIWIRDIFSN